MSRDDQARGFARFLYTQNPFYLISACLILYGLYVVFGDAEGNEGNPWPLAAALGGYTLLMALTVYALVRFGRVWDDARSILIIVLLLLLGLSASFDEVCNTSPTAAKLVLLRGLAFSLAICESLLRGLKIRLAVGYRGPFYLLLTIFFVAPLCCSPLVTGLSRETILWRIFFFPVLAGAAYLLLLPAIRREGEAARDNGTPWRWPWFPGTIFTFLALGVAGRAYSLCLSFDEQIGLVSVFGLYYLLPLFFALGLVLLEVARVGRYAWLSRIVLSAAPLMLLLAGSRSGSPAYEQFLAEVTTTIGSPWWSGLVGLAGFYAYAWRRGYQVAEVGVTAGLVGLCFVSPNSGGWNEFSLSQWWPLGVLAAIQTSLAIRSRTSHRCLAAAWTCIAAGTVGLRDTQFVAWQGIVPLHLAAASLLVVGFLFHDAFACVARKLAAACFVLAGLTLATQFHRPDAPFQLIAIYYLALAVLAVFCGWQPADRWFRVACLVDAAAGWGTLLAAVSHSLHGRIPPQAVYCLLFGVVFFGIAISISFAKCGWLKQIARYVTLCLVFPTSEPERPA